MKRALIVYGLTATGLTSLYMFHTAPIATSVGGLVASPTTVPIVASTIVPSSTPTTVHQPTPTTVHQSTPTTPTTVHQSTPTTVHQSTPTTPTTVHQSTPTTAPATPTTVPSSVRTATGQTVNYYFGLLSVRVTATGKRITAVTMASLSDGGNYRSQSIDQQSIPLLEQEALQAQSARIQSISGASYTSAGFAQSLQSALTQLGI